MRCIELMSDTEIKTEIERIKREYKNKDVSIKGSKVKILNV